MVNLEPEPVEKEAIEVHESGSDNYAETSGRILQSSGWHFSLISTTIVPLLVSSDLVNLVSL